MSRAIPALLLHIFSWRGNEQTYLFTKYLIGLQKRTPVAQYIDHYAQCCVVQRSALSSSPPSSPPELFDRR